MSASQRRNRHDNPIQQYNIFPICTNGNIITLHYNCLYCERGWLSSLTNAGPIMATSYRRTNIQPELSECSRTLQPKMHVPSSSCGSILLILLPKWRSPNNWYPPSDGMGVEWSSPHAPCPYPPTDDGSIDDLMLSKTSRLLQMSGWIWWCHRSGFDVK